MAGFGSSLFKRKTGNTLGCLKSNNNLIASQPFFALRLAKPDLLKVLKAMQTASIATSIKVPQVVRNGGPADVRDAVMALGKTPSSKDKFPVMQEPLSIMINNKPVVLIAKPSNVNVPPWQIVSSLLSGASARAATWWTARKIPSTLASTKSKCMDNAIKVGTIKDKAGPVAIALTGEWKNNAIKIYAPSSQAKIGVATSNKNER